MTVPDPIGLLSQRIAALTGRSLTRDEVLTVVGRAFEHGVDVDDDGQLRALVAGLASSDAVGGPAVANNHRDQTVASTKSRTAPRPPASPSGRPSSSPPPSGMTAITMAVLALLGGIANVVLAAVLITAGGDYVSHGDPTPGWYHPTIYVVGGCGFIVAVLLLAGGAMTLLRKRFGPPITALGCALCIAVFFADMAVTLAAADSDAVEVRGSPIHYLAGLIFPAVTLILAMLPATKRWSTDRGRPTPEEGQLDDDGGSAATREAPTHVGSDGTTPPPKWRRAALAAAILLVAASVVSVGVVAIGRFRHSQSSPRPATAAARPDGRQVELDFGDIANSESIAVDTAGNVYVSVSNPTYGVLKLGHGARVPDTLPFPAHSNYSDIPRVDPYGVAVDATGNVYVAYARDNRVLKLAAGTNIATELPFTGLDRPFGVGVDTAGNVYVTDSGNHRVLKLAAGTQTPTTLPFTGLQSPYGVAIDANGNVYVTDDLDSRVRKLAAHSGTVTYLPFTGFGRRTGVAVDTAGSVYIVDENAKQVLKLAAGADTQTQLPFSGLKSPQGVAVDDSGNVYVLDRGGRNRILELLAH